MERFEREQAHLMDIPEITKMMQSEEGNRTVSQLIFMEARKTDNRGALVFPCYPVMMDEKKDGTKFMIFYLVQCIQGQYSTMCLQEDLKDMGTRFRFWNLPPTKSLMEANPMKDTAEVQ